MQNHKFAIFSLFFILLFAPVAVHAFSIQKGSVVYIAKDQTIEGNLYAAGSDVTVDGHVTGDVFCAGQSININGTVDGDVICAEQAITISGNVGGSVRTAGSSIAIRGKIARGLTMAGANMDLSKDASIGWDALIAAANANLKGNIGRSLLGAGTNFVLSGNIGKDAVLYAGNNKQGDLQALTVMDSAVIGGTLEYTSRLDASISSKAQIKGKVTHNTPPVGARETPKASGWFGLFLIAALSALAVGYILVGVWKKPILDMTDTMIAQFWPTLGWGVVWTIIAPLTAILLAITLIGFRLTLLTIWTWLILLMLSKVVVGIAIGRWLLNELWEDKKDSISWAIATGIILCWIVFYIPVIGWFLSLVAVWWGVGAILLYLKHNYDMSKKAEE